MICFHAYRLHGDPYWAEAYDFFGPTGIEYRRQKSKCMKCGKVRAKSIGGTRYAR